MPDVLFARWQMAMSLGFHIVFAAVGIAMPVLMVAAEILARRRNDPDYLALARRWAKGTAVFFAVGAVSGTVLSFELGLLFPRFMAEAGAIVGMPFSLEGFAFFTEAIFLGLYLYGWERMRPTLHIASGIIVAASGLASAIFVTCVNAWMNAPAGARRVGDVIVDVDPWAGLSSPFVLHEVLHTTLAAYMVTTFAVAGIHAWALLRSPSLFLFHKKALKLALAVGIPCALVQPLVGHLAGQTVARHQPLKLAAMENIEVTSARAPLRLGPITIPGAVSFLAFNDVDAVVTGLDAFAPEDWPHPIVHVAFLTMVGAGTLLAGFSALILLARLLHWRPRRERPFLLATVACAPLGLVAMEAGWVVTEVGRQPWVVYGILRTQAAATPMPGLIVPFVCFTLVYLGLGAVVLLVLRSQVRATLEHSGSR